MDWIDAEINSRKVKLTLLTQHLEDLHTNCTHVNNFTDAARAILLSLEEMIRALQTQDQAQLDQVKGAIIVCITMQVEKIDKWIREWTGHVTLMHNTIVVWR
jgi:hypothetical protein